MPDLSCPATNPVSDDPLREVRPLEVKLSRGGLCAQVFMKGFRTCRGHRSRGEVLTDMLNPLCWLDAVLFGIGEQLPARFCQSLGIPGFDEGMRSPPLPKERGFLLHRSQSSELPSPDPREDGAPEPPQSLTSISRSTAR